MSIATLHVEPETNPIGCCRRWTLTPKTVPGPAHFLSLDADGTAAVGVGTPLYCGVGVHEVAEIEVDVLLVERLGN